MMKKTKRHRETPSTQRHPRSEIGLAEAVQVCRTLGVRDGPRAQWLAESLGLTWQLIARPDQTMPVTPRDSPVSRETTPQTAPPAMETRKLTLLNPVASEPMVFEKIFAGRTQEIRTATEIRPASLVESEQRPEFQPLFLDRWFQGIFTAVLAVRVRSQEIDFRKLERSVIQGEYFTQLPFKLRTKLVKGVHVLLDRSESMQPFWRDEAELLARLRRMLGDVLVQHSWFEFEAATSRIIWRTPPPAQFRMETPVLIVTDFGSGSDPLSVRMMNWEPWLPVLERARSSHASIFALIPSSTGFWPAAIDRFIDCSLLWDRETSPQTAARLCRRY
jgi:hypothetical protein